MERFFQETWFLWWLLALVAIVRWYWINLSPGRSDRDRRERPWKELYRAALVEREPSHLALLIEEAEESILYELSAHPFTNAAEWQSLHDALSNLRVLRDNPDLAGRAEIKHAMTHRSTRRNRVRHC